MGISVYPASSVASYSPTATARAIDEFTSLNSTVPGTKTRNVTVPAGALTLYSSIPATFTINGASVYVAPNTPKNFFNTASTSSYTVNLVMQTPGFSWRTSALPIGARTIGSYSGWTGNQNSTSAHHGSIAAGAGTFCFLTDDSSYAYTSTDNGNTWTTGSAPANTYHLLSFSGTLFYSRLANNVAGSATAYSSTNGTTWTARTFTAAGNWNRPLNTTGTNYVCTRYNVNASTASQLTNVSTNGTTWTAGGNLPSLATWFDSDVDPSTGRIITAAYYDSDVTNAITTTKAATTTDNGATWSALTLPASDNWLSVWYLNGTWVALGNSAYATSTNNGTTWTSRTYPSIGSGGTAQASPGNAYLGSNGSTNMLYLPSTAALTSNAFAATTDGINWTGMPSTAANVNPTTTFSPSTMTTIRGTATLNSVFVTGFSATTNYSAISSFVPASVGVYAGPTTTI